MNVTNAFKTINDSISRFNNLQNMILVLTSLITILSTSLPNTLSMMHKLFATTLSTIKNMCIIFYRSIRRQRTIPSQLSIKIYSSLQDKEMRFLPQRTISPDCTPLLWYLNKLNTNRCIMIQSKSIKN